MWDSLDQIFCINLPERTDRKSVALEEFSIFTDPSRVKFLPAFNPKDLRLTSERFFLTPGMIGCWLSHLSIYNYAKAFELNAFAVFEDDFKIIDGGEALMKNALENIPEDWEFVWLGYSYNGHENNKKDEVYIKDYWMIPGSTCCTHAYMVRGKKTIDFLLKNLSEIRNQIDLQLTYEVLKNSGIKVYAPTIPIFTQNGFKSDVQI